MISVKGMTECLIFLHLEQGKDNSSKRLLSPLQCWVANLEVPNDSYELLYRLGQKTETFEKVKVEYFAPFLLKEGVVQRIQHYHKPLTDNIEAINLPYHTIEKFRSGFIHSSQLQSPEI